MNKNYLLSLSGFVALLALSSCSSDIDNNMVDDQISYLKGDVVRSVSVFDEKYDLSVIKSGKGRTDATVTIAFADTALTNYNTSKGTAYRFLPSEHYSLSTSLLNFGKSDAREISELSWKQDKVLSAIGDDENYAIPCKIFSKGTASNLSNDLVILNLKKSSVTMDTQLAATLTPTADETLVDTLTSSISMDYPISNKSLEVNLEIDNSLIAAYNSANGTSYTEAPKGLISLPSSSVTIDGGQASVEFKYVITGSKFFDNGSLISFSSYLVPVKIASTSISGVGVKNQVMFIPVKNETKVLMGPWKVIEGADQCYGREEGSPNWAKGYLVDRMVDGNLATEWISKFQSDNTFPMAFVFDMGSMHLFNVFKIKDHGTFQGNYREYEIYMAKDYKEAATEWVKVASGKRGYGWTSGGGLYDFNVQKTYVGRYLKFVIVKPESSAGDYAHGRGKLSEIYGEGL